jgi:hypothetical protein
MSYIKKKHQFIFLGFATLLNCSSCGNNVSLSPQVSRFIASEHLKKFTPEEIMAKGIKQFISEEQKISIGLSKSGTFSSPYSPKNNPKFPLPYYLVPEESAHFYYTNNLDPRISGQLSMKISGKKHYKFFIHPELETYFDYLRLAFSYVGADKTEFWATPTSNYRSLVVWNKNNTNRKPFIAKISLDKKTSHEMSLGDEDNDIERILAYQRFFENIGDNKLSQISLNYFPETAGMDLEKIHPFKHEKIQAQSIQEIPDELLLDKKHWTSLATLIEAQTSHPHQLMEFITKSGMSSYQFVEDQMINQYLKIDRNSFHFW